MSNDEREWTPEKAERVDRRAFLEVAVGAAVAGTIPEIAVAQNSRSDGAGGPLYMQTNEIQNALVKIDTSPGLPSELCWLSISPDGRTV
jgi:hypothetical protein